MKKIFTLIFTLAFFVKASNAQNCNVTINYYLVDSFLTATAHSADSFNTVNYKWTLSGNGSVLKSTNLVANPNFSYTFHQSGTFTLTAYDSVNATMCANTANASITYSATAAPACQAAFIMYPDSTTPGNYYAYNYSHGTGVTYTWYWGDGTSSTGTAPTHMYSTSGYYIIKLKISNGSSCTDSMSVNYFVARMKQTASMHMISVVDKTGASGIETMTNAQKFNVYPNPAQSRLNFVCNENGNALISLYNLNGQKVNEINTAVRQINIENLPSGMYFVEAKINGNIYRNKFVKE
jgi:PKD repeat protein